MPTYQYVCTNCGEQLEAVQKFTDDPLTVCPACEGRLRKQFNSVGIVFKGSGFYRTDSRNGSSDKSLKADAAKASNGSSSSGSASSGESKSESKSNGSSTASTSANGSTTNGSSTSKSGSSPAKAASA